MTPFLHRLLTNSDLMTRAGKRYEGRILGVAPQRVFNKFKLTKEETVPLITFEDGWQWIPNISARRLLSAAWGVETDGWIGRPMVVYLCAVARSEKGSGRLVERWEKRVEPLEDDDADGG